MRGKSLFDYNFSKDEIRIDECRNSSSYYIEKAIACKLGNADATILAEVFRSVTDGEETLEGSLNQDYIFGDYTSPPTETQSEVWARAWEASAGCDAVVCQDKFSADYVEKKGYKPKAVGQWAKSLQKAGVKSADSVLNADEKAGRTILPPTKDAEKAVQWAWEVFSAAGLVGEHTIPTVNCFREISKAGCINSGFYKDGQVYINLDIANDGQNKELLKTALEEVAHYITGATDNSRDFQNFFIDTIISIAS